MGPKPTRTVAADAIRHELASRHDEMAALAGRLADVLSRIEHTRTRSRALRARTQHPRIDQLHDAIRSRDVIGQAKGLLMATGLSEDEAFDLLKRASQRANVKLRDIAGELVIKGPAFTPAGAGALERARQAAGTMEVHRLALARLAQERADAVRVALAEGMSRAEVARQLGVTPQAITKLLSRLPGPPAPSTGGDPSTGSSPAG